MKRLTGIVLASLTLGACSHTAGDGKPLVTPSKSDLYYGSQVSLGPCLGDGESALGTAFATALITTGVNRIGAAIKSAAAGQTTTSLARRNIEISNRGPIGPCVYVARGWFHRARPNFDDASGAGYVQSERTGFVYDDAGGRAALWGSGLYLAGTPDFFFQGQVVASEGNRAYTIVPRKAWLAEPLVANDLRSDARNVLLSFALVPLDKPATLEKGGSTVVLGRLEPGVMRNFPAQPCAGRVRTATTNGPNGPINTQTAIGCDGDATGLDYLVLRSSFESEWFTVSLTADRQPMTLLALASETRGSSAFLAYVSDVFTATAPALNTALANELVPDSIAAAGEAEITASELLLTGYDTAYGAAATAFAECVAAPANAAKRTTARVALRNLLAAARRAEIPVGSLTTLQISADGDDPAQCQAARDAIVAYAPGGVSRLAT